MFVVGVSVRAPNPCARAGSACDLQQGYEMALKALLQPCACNAPRVWRWLVAVTRAAGQGLQVLVPAQLGWRFQVPVGVRYLHHGRQVLPSLLLRVSYLLGLNKRSVTLNTEETHTMLDVEGQTSNGYMGLGFISGHCNEHFCFVLFPLVSACLWTG